MQENIQRFQTAIAINSIMMLVAHFWKLIRQDANHRWLSDLCVQSYIWRWWWKETRPIYEFDDEDDWSLSWDDDAVDDDDDDCDDDDHNDGDDYDDENEEDNDNFWCGATRSAATFLHGNKIETRWRCCCCSKSKTHFVREKEIISARWHLSRSDILANQEKIFLSLKVKNNFCEEKKKWEWQIEIEIRCS